MAPLPTLREFLLQQQRKTEFDLSTGDLTKLEVRSARDTLCYLYDTGESRLIKSFVLRVGPQVDTMCDVTLVRSGDRYSPRLAVWKKDKTKRRPEVLSEEELIKEGRTLLIKSRVDLDDCHENFWKVVDFLKTIEGVEFESSGIRATPKDEADLIEALRAHDKDSVLKAVRTFLGGNVSVSDVEMLLDRRSALEEFRRLLTDDEYFKSETARHGGKPERVWQDFFEENVWIFGYGLTFLACEKVDRKALETMTSGRNVFTGAGKRLDAVMRTKGFIQTLVFAEIKTHNTPLLSTGPYRPPDVYQASRELSGAISQIQKTVHKSIHDLMDLHRVHDASGQFRFEASTIRPRQVIVIGNLSQLEDDGEINVEKLTSLDLFRRSQLGIEILTFDELFERAKYIVESEGEGQ